MSRDRIRTLIRELTSFCIVGGIGLIADVSIFNILRMSVLSPTAVHGGPVLAKLVSTIVAIALNWIGNRLWTFRDKRSSNVVREGIEFAVASMAGLVISVGCLWLAHYVLGFRTILDDNISSNVIGLAMGTAARYALYRWWVFGPHTDSATSAAFSTAPEKVDTGL